MERKDLLELGKQLTTVEPEDIEEGALWVCGSSTSHTDSVWTTCADCGVAVCHRPHAPAQTKKVCLNCAMKFMDAEPEATFAVTTSTKLELEQELQQLKDFEKLPKES